MNILIFEYKNFGIEDIQDALTKLGHTFKVVTTDSMRDRINEEFDKIFEEAYGEDKYDLVYTFNYSPVVSINCNKRNIPYVSFLYDSPQVLLYSYTIINPCNYVFIFDKAMYLELKNEGINTVYYAPLCANVERLDAMAGDTTRKDLSRFSGDIAFVGSMYNEDHNLYDRMVAKGLSEFSKGYLDAVMDAQMKVYGYFFMQDMLSGQVLKDMVETMPAPPSAYGVETTEYLYAHYFLARKLAAKERMAIMRKIESELLPGPVVNLFTPNPTPELKKINNCGPIDYYNDMPYIFKKSRINLNISLRSIRTGIPLRGIDIMGAGGFLLSNYQEDFYDYFVPGEDCVLFESHDDLIRLCKYYLSHESERAQIAANGYGKVKEFHTYEKRLQEIFEIVFN